MALLAVKHLDPVVGVDVHSVLVTPGTPPVFLPHPHVGFMLDKREYIQAAKAVVGCIATMIAQEKVTEYIEHHPDDVTKLEHLADEANQQVNDLMGGGKLPDTVAEGIKLANEANKIKNRISDDLGSNVGSGGSSGRPIFVNGMMRATAGTHAYHVPGLHFPLGESFAPPPEEVQPSNDGESFMGSKTVLANNDPMSYMALEALSCWSIGMEPPPHNSAHTDRTYPSMPSSVMLPIPAGRPVFVGGPPIMNMAAAAKGLFKAFQGSKWAKALADKLHLKSGFLRCNVLKAEPVDATTGEVVIQQRDFTVSGRLPFVWERHYSSRNPRYGAVGAGWQTPADIRLELTRHEGAVAALAYFPDHATAFDAMPDAAGWPARVHDWQHGYALYQRHNGLVLRTRSGIEYQFPLPAHWQRTLEVLADDAPLVLPVERIADLHGNAWAFRRRPDGSLACLVEWKGSETTGRMIESDAAVDSRPEERAKPLVALTQIDSDGHAHPLVSYEHDRSGNLITALDAMSQPHHFVYDDGHRMVRHTSARGISFYYDHQQHDDGVWRVEHAWGEDGLFDYRFDYDVKHRATRISNSLGHTTILQTDENGRPVAQIDPLGGTTSYQYDGQGRARAVTDPVGRVTTWTYDAYGNLLAQTLPDGGAVRTEYDARHRPICVNAPGNRQWRFAWDERGNLLAQTAPLQARTHYEYDRHGQLIGHTNPCGAVTRFDYDRDGNLEAVTDALGYRTRYAHDARANVTEAVDALGQTSRYEYDRNGNLTRAIEPGKREIFCGYDGDGNLTSYRDPDGQVTQFEYSPLGRISRKSTPDGGVLQYRYNTEEQLTGVVNERGQLYQLKRDVLGRLVEEVDYWGQVRRYEYGGMGELRRSTDPAGRVIDYETDALGRIVRKYVPDPRQIGGIRTETFSYDHSGNLIAAASPDGRVEFTYDEAGRIVKEQQGGDFVVAHRYDIAGNRIERRTRLSAAGEIVTHRIRYEYDALGTVEAIRIDDASPITFERDALGRILVEHLGDDLKRELSYTSEGLLAKQALLAGTGLLFATEYEYDATGDVMEKRDSRLGIERYQYDPVGRLTGHVDVAGKLHRFLYDPTGDLLKTRTLQGNRPDALGRGAAANTSFREGEYQGCHYAFDSVGNLVRKQDRDQDLILTWDGDGLLIESLTVRQASGEGASSGVTLSIRTRYGYDALHRRVNKVTEIQRDSASPARSTFDGSILSRSSQFFWDGDALVGEVSQGDRTARALLRGEFSGEHKPGPERSPDAQATAFGKDGDVRVWVHYPNSFVPLAGIQRTLEPTPERQTLHYFQTDPSGAPTRVTDASGTIVWEVAYTAQGNLSQTGAGTHFDQPLRLQGQYYDDESGLHYNRYRYFDSRTSSFISQDPIGLSGGENLYAFAPSTLNWTDPLGLRTGRFPHWNVGEVGPLGHTILSRIKGADGKYDHYENPGTHDPKGKAEGRCILDYNPTKSVLPEDHQSLFEGSESAPGHRDVRIAVGPDGVVHQFQGNSHRTYHWAGSTNGRTLSGEERKDIAAAKKYQSLVNKIKAKLHIP